MDPILGEIRLFAGNYAPDNWHICDGSLLAISQYTALYSLLSTTYGGDGRTTFGIPDLRGKVVVNQGQGTGLTFNYPLGAKAGAETVTIVEATLPAHNHTFTASQQDATVTTPGDNYLAVPSDPTPANRNLGLYIPDTAPETVQALLPTALTYQGGNQPHENRMPYMALNYIIATAGIYPNPGQ